MDFWNPTQDEQAKMIASICSDILKRDGAQINYYLAYGEGVSYFSRMLEKNSISYTQVASNVGVTFLINQKQ